MNNLRRLLSGTHFLFAVWVAGCDKDTRSTASHGNDPSPFAIQIDSISLEETDDFYVGEPYGITIDTKGTLFVSDGSSGSVLQFDRSGKPVRKFGRRGKGPGELLGPGPLLALGDSLLVVADQRNRKLLFYDIDGGGLRREVKNIGLITSIDQLSDGLLLGRMDIKNRTSVAFLSADSDSVEQFGPIPSEYFESPALASIHTVSLATSDRGYTTVGASGSDKLFRLDGSRKTVDSLRMPARVRRGVPIDIVAEYNKSTSMEQKALLSSALVAAGPGTDGWIGLVYMDYTLVRDAVTARAFLAIFNWRTRTACVDREVKLAGHARPVVTIADGKFVALEQVVGSSTRPITTLRFFAMDNALCMEQQQKVE